MVTYNDSIRLIFGLKLKALRQQHGMNYKQLADLTGIAVSYLHDIESGKKYPKTDKIIILAKTLKVDYDYLVSLTANKKLQPIIDLMSSDFISMIPWEHFGITPSALLDLFTNAPDKVTAFISTILKLSRSVQMSTDIFYTSALRSYQDLHDNYFEELEIAALKLREKAKIKTQLPIHHQPLELFLKKNFNITVDKNTLETKEELKNIRSFYAAPKKTLYINTGLSLAQEKYLLARELAFQSLQIQPRPYETAMHKFDSFEMVLNNFKASYFSNALLIPEDSITEDVKNIASITKWSDKLWLDLLGKYDVTPEMLMQRLTNILPRHFGIDQLFFLRMTSNMNDNTLEMTKELHLSKLHNPYANALHEHYCGRWIAIATMNEVYDKVLAKKYRHPLVHVQISQYWQTHNRYLCVTFAKPQTKQSDKIVSVTLGMLIDNKLMQRMPFVNDQSIPVKMVHTTCERCGIMDCKERAAAPIYIEQLTQKEKIEAVLQELQH